MHRPDGLNISVHYSQFTIHSGDNHHSCDALKQFRLNHNDRFNFYFYPFSLLSQPKMLSAVTYRPLSISLTYVSTASFFEMR